MNTDTLVRFYVNNGTDETVKMLGVKGKGLLEFIISDEKANLWTKNVAKHLLDELTK